MKRYYTLFKRERGSRLWSDCGRGRYDKQTAIRIFQNDLLYPFLTGDLKFEFELRPVR